MADTPLDQVGHETILDPSDESGGRPPSSESELESPVQAPGEPTSETELESPVQAPREPTSETELESPVQAPRERTFRVAKDSLVSATHRELGTTVSTPREALRQDELRSTRTFLAAAIVLSTVVAALLPFLQADPVARIALLLGIAVTMVGLGSTLWAVRTSDGYTPARALVLVLCCGVGVCTALYYFGVLSGASLGIAIGIFFFGVTHEDLVALTGSIAAMAGAFALWLLVVTGVIDDRGMQPISTMSLSNQVILIFLMEFAFGTTLAIARGSRRARMQTVQELDAAVRQVAQRQALLDEARRELDQALCVDGAGRMSEQVLGSFRLGGLVGRGAMGEVYQAVHTETGQLAAVKLLNRGVLGIPEHVQRFVREAKIAASLKTPHVVTVLEVGDERSPLPYIAMELLQGEDLAHILRDKRSLPPAQVVQLLQQIAIGLDAAHAEGIVHRDLKPQNIFRHELASGNRVWKLLDFGVSRLMNSDGTLTQGQAIGTPSYMAPEQARGLQVDHRADLFALGVLAYRCLTGRPAFTGRDVPGIMHKVAYSVPPRPSELAPLTAEVDAVLAIAMAKAPAERFRSGGELAGAMHLAVTDVLPESLLTWAERIEREQPWGTRLR